MTMPDFPLGETLDFKFTTRAFDTGIPTTLAGTPSVEAYEDNSLTKISAGITLTVDFNSIAGLHNVRIVATGANGFESGKSYALVVTAGNVGGVSVVGEVVQQFTIERQASDVRKWAGTGGAAIKLGVSGLPEVEAGAIADAAIGASSFAAGAIDNAAIAAGAITSTEAPNLDVTVGSRQPEGPVAITAASVDAIWDEAQAGHTTAGTFGFYLDAQVSGASPAAIAAAVWDEDASGHQTTGTFGLAIGDPGGSANSIYNIVSVQLDANVGSRAQTGDQMDLVTDAIDSDALAISGVNEIRDGILDDATRFSGANIDASIASRSTFDATVTITEAYAADGAEFNFEQALYMIWSALGQYDITGTTITARRLDGTTQSMAFTMDDASNPTSRTRTA